VEIELVRGTRRRKYVEGTLVGDRLRVSFPYWMSLAEAQRTAEELRERMQRRVSASRIDLPARARALARRHGFPVPAVVEWSDRQQHRWGSCAIDDRTIRVSSRLASFPDWVLDYVLVHELAHLLEASHGPRFRALVDRYPLAERARGFLIAKDLEADRSPA
jgi:predicted metal-dependent hydrolase